MTEPLKLHKPEPWPDLVQHLEGLLEDAKSGELMGLFEICWWRGDSVSSGWCARRPDRRVIGALEELKYELVTKLK